MNEWIVWWMNELLWDVWVDICNCVCNVLYYILICVFVFQGQIKPLYENKPHETYGCVSYSSTRTRNKWRPMSVGVFHQWCRSHSRCATLDWCGAAVAGAEPFVVTDGHGIVITYPCWLLNYLCVYLRPPYQIDAVPLIELTRRNPWTIGYCDHLLIVSYRVYMWFN